jgi:hypothetical protein
MFYRCIKVQRKPLNIQVRDPNSKEQRNQVCCGLAHRTVHVPPDSVRCTRSVQNWTSHSRVSEGALRYNSPDYSVCQRATAILRNDQLQKEHWQHYSEEQCAAESECRVRGAPDSEQDMSGVTSDCPVPQEDIGANSRLLPNPNGWVTWRRTG